MVPKFSTPMTKFIRTGEGILVFAFNAAMVVIPILSNALSPAEALKWAAVVNVATVISRTGLKAITAVTGVTGITPDKVTTSAQLGPDAQAALDAVKQDVATVGNKQETLEQRVDALLGGAPDQISQFEQTIRDAADTRITDDSAGSFATGGVVPAKPDPSRMPFDQAKAKAKT